MERTNVFISYSRADHEWRRRLMLHLAVLERSGLIDVWSDARLEVGSTWQLEIEEALTRSKVAVLLVTPSFLASRFIWDQEMPRILKHAEAGMAVLPLVARPCAWRLEPALEKLQARPSLGRPLSLGSESDVDLELAAFAYELAARINPQNSALAAQERERAEQFKRQGTSRSTRSSRESGRIVNASRARPQARSRLLTLSQWTGHYNPDTELRLVIREVKGGEFRGHIEYPAKKVKTKVEGAFSENWSASDPLWAQMPESYSNYQLALALRETGYEKRGIGGVSFDGEYRALVAGDVMTGAWFSGTRLVGTLRLVRDSHKKGRAALAK